MTPGPEPTRPRRSVVAAVVVPALLALLTGALVAIDRPFAPEVGGEAARFLPPDGAHARYRAEDGTVRAVDSARTVGAVGTLVGPDAVSIGVIGSVGDEAVRSASYWRQITTTAEEQFQDLYVIGDDGLRQVAGWGGAVGFTFSPGLLLLPADVEPGSRWTSSGSALGDGALTFDSEFRASAADEELTGADGERFRPDPECLRVDGTLTFEQPGVGVLVESVDTSVWCPGRGIVFSVGTQNGQAVGSVAVPESTPLPPAGTGTAASAASAARRGDLEALDAVLVDPFFGESRKSGSLTTAPVAPVTGLVVTANEHGDDLLAWRIEDGRAALAWSAHPGGTVAAVSAVGDLTIAATQDRAVRAYDDRGRRLWSWLGDDLALAPAVAAPEPEGESLDVILATRGGTLARLDAATGREAWSSALGAEARGRIAVAGDTVVVADERGRLSGWDAATGELRWRADRGMSAGLSAAPDGRLVYLATEDGEVLGVDAATGEALWDGSLRGLLRGVVADADGAVALSDEELVRFGADGVEEWSAPGATAALAVRGGRVLTLVDRTVALRGAGGAVLDEWRLPPSDDPADPRIVLSGDDAVIVGPALQFWRVGLG